MYKRQLEDLCDQIGLLSAGKILFAKDLDALKLGFCRVPVSYTHLDVYKRQPDLLHPRAPVRRENGRDGITPTNSICAAFFLLLLILQGLKRIEPVSYTHLTMVGTLFLS